MILVFTLLWYFALLSVAYAEPITLAIAGAVGLGGVFTAGSIATSIAGVVLGTSVAVGASFLARTLAPKTKQKHEDAPQTTGPQGTELTLSASPSTPRSLILGTRATAGSLVYWCTSGTNNEWLTMVIALADHRCYSLERIWVDGKLVSWAPTAGAAASGHISIPEYNGYLTVAFYDGSPTQFPDDIVIDDSPFREGSVTEKEWTDDHALNGIAYVVVKCGWKPEQFKGGGVPQFLFELRGAYLYDPRKDTTVGGSGAHRWTLPATHEWTENLEVARYNYLRGIAYGVDGQPLFGVGLSPSAIDNDRAFAAMNSCDEVMTLQYPAPPYGFTVEYRYRISALITSDMQHRTVLEKMALACAGDVPDLSGKYALTPGAPQIAVASIIDNDILVGEELTGSRHTSRREKANEVTGQWANPEALYQRVDVPARWSDVDEEQDGGFRNATSFDLDFVASQTQGQRVLEIMRRLERRQRTHTLTLSRKFAYLEAGDWLVWNSDVFGLVNRTFRIEQVSLHPDWRITLSIREIDTDVYAWNQVVDEIDPANPHALASGGPDIEMVEDFAVSMVTVTGTDGEQIPGLYCTWTPIFDPTVVAIRIEYRRVGDTPWQAYTWPFPATGGVTITDGIVTGSFYEARATPITDPPRTVQVTVPVSTETVAPTMIVSTVKDGGITMSKLDAELQEALGGVSVDTDPPDVPTGLAVTSTVQKQSSGELVATVVATVNASASPNFLENEFEVSKAGGPFSSYATHGNRYEWTAFLPGTAIQVRARSWSVNGFESAWSSTVSHTVAANTTPPGNVTSLVATTGLRFVSFDFTPPTDVDLECVEIHKSTTNNRASATLAARVAAPNKFAFVPMVPGETAYFWAIAKNTSGIFSVNWFPVSTTAGVAVTVSRAISDDVADAAIAANNLAANAITAAAFAGDVRPVELVNSLPGPPHQAGRIVYFTTNGKLYRNTGTGWTTAVEAVDIVASWITAGVISAGAISTTELAAGAVTADKIAAQSISASKLAVTSYMENLVTNGDFSDGLTNWSTQTSSSLSLAAGVGVSGSQALRVDRVGTTASAIFNRFMPIEGGKAYELAAYVQPSSSGGSFSLNIYFYNSSQVLLGSATPVVSSASTGLFTRLAAQFTSLSTAKYALVEVLHSTTNFWVDGVSLRATSGATLIQDGAITTNKMTANSISGDRITAGTLSADKLVALSITAAQLAANAITADKIAAGEVTTSKLAVGAVGSSTQIADGVITTNKMTANSISGDRITAGTLSADKIAANSITSSQLSTTTLITSSGQIGNLVVASANIAELTVGTTKITDTAVSTGHIASTAINAAAVSVSLLALQKVMLIMSAYTGSEGLTTAGMLLRLAQSGVGYLVQVYMNYGARTSIQTANDPQGGAQFVTNVINAAYYGVTSFQYVFQQGVSAGLQTFTVDTSNYEGMSVTIAAIGLKK